MTGAEPRHGLFEAARQRAELSVPELWLRYLALTGTGDVFDVEAFLHGLVPLNHHEQDVLAVALNERLEEVYHAARVPYLFNGAELPSETEDEDPLDVLHELLQHPHARLGPPEGGTAPPLPPVC